MTHTQTQGADGAGTKTAGQVAVRELEWLRRQVIELCEHTEDKAGAELERPDLCDHERGFHKGAYTEAKGIRRAIAETVRCRLKDLEGSTPAPTAQPGVPDSLRALSEAATAGPFSVSGVRKRYVENSCVIVDAPTCSGLFAFATADGRETLTALADAKFFVAAANHVRALIAAQPAGQGTEDTKPSAGRKIIAGLQDAVAFARGDTTRGRVIRVGQQYASDQAATIMHVISQCGAASISNDRWCLGHELITKALLSQPAGQAGDAGAEDESALSDRKELSGQNVSLSPLRGQIANAKATGVNGEMAAGEAYTVFDPARTTSDPYDDRPGPWYDMKKVREIEAATGIAFAAAHPERALGRDTDGLIEGFAAALKAKLRAAEAKYGWQNGWLKDDWSADCQRELMRHVGKGDPLDVAAYAAFCWHHGWSTSSAPTGTPDTEKCLSALTAAVSTCINDKGITDLGTIKRAWFYARTGRDEPVGSRAWDELRAMVRASEASSGLEGVETIQVWPLGKPAPNSTRTGAKCAARRQGTAGGNDPADCDWPMCGCDPHADKVIAALQECGHLLAPAPNSTHTGAAETEETVAKALYRHDYGSYPDQPEWDAAPVSVQKRYRALSEAALAARPEAPSDAGWRDISTAPKDGKKLLLCVAGYEPAIGGWFEKRWLSFDPESFDHDTLERWLADTTYEPTHWQPVPATPPSDPAPSGQAEG